MYGRSCPRGEIGGSLRSALRQQVIWTFKGIPSTNKAYPIVHEYLTRKMLTKIGTVFPEPSDWEIEAYHLIENTLETERKKQNKK